ncbi:transposase family protein [Streptomyces sp. NPDC053429]|uniref:transposase family protein n=1 Tax=Streptomyces sp. NPDC053429 TaxID=3365702 RepID=UPI0037D3E41B
MHRSGTRWCSRGSTMWMSRRSRPRSARSRWWREAARPGAACPGCGCFSGRVHGRYQRRLKDLPLAEQGFVIRLTVRRSSAGRRTARAGRSPSRSPGWPPRTHGSRRGSTAP